MKRIIFLPLIAALLVVVGITGSAFAQATAPSLVTQQLRLSDGAGNYVGLRAGTGGVASNGDALYYSLDGAATAAAGVSYALWVNDQNHIVRSVKFGLTADALTPGSGGAGYLYRVNAAGTGTEWVLPSDITSANQGLSIDSSTSAGTAIVQLGSTTTNHNPITNTRFVTQVAGGSLTFDGTGSLSIGDGTGAMNLTIDPSATGTVRMNNIPAQAIPLATDQFLMIDPAAATPNTVKTRLISSLVAANNGLIIDPAATATATVQLGGPLATPAPLIRDAYIDMATFTTAFVGGGNFTIGTTAAVTNITIDPGNTTGVVTMPNIDPNPAPSATDRLLILDGTNTVLTRALTSLVDANSGLTLDVGGAVPTVQLGDSATGIGQHPLNQDRYVTLGNHDIHFQGAGNFVIGDGAATTGLTVDPGAAGFITLNNIDAAVVAPSDRMLILDNANHVLTRNLTSLIQANEGTTIDSSTGTAIVQLGHATDGQSQITVPRFITMTGATPSLTWNGTGKMNLGTTGNLGVSINNGTDSLLITNSRFISSAVVASPSESRVHNLMYVDEATNAVHAVTATGMARNDAPTDYVAIDPSTGNIIKSISPTAGILRGQISGTGTFTYNSPNTLNIQAGASITVSIENHASSGTVAVQVTSVTANTNASAPYNGVFSVECADNIPAGSFINWVVINP